MSNYASTIFIEPIDHQEYKQTLLGYLSEKHKWKILQFVRAKLQFVNAIESNVELLNILVAELNEIGPNYSEAEYLNAIDAWKNFVNANDLSLNADDQEFRKIIIEESEWIEPTDRQIHCVIEHLKSKTISDKVWSKISSKLNVLSKTNKSISFWTQYFMRFGKQLKAREELIDTLSDKYEHVPLCLTKLEKNLLKLINKNEKLDADDFKAHCRICLAPNSPEMLPLFIETIADNDSCSLLDKIIFCSCLKMTPRPDDNLPQYICLSCSILLENSYQFHSLCMKTEEKLQKILNNENELQNELYSDEHLDNSLMQNEGTILEIQGVDFIECSKTTYEYNHIKEVREKFHIEVSKPRKPSKPSKPSKSIKPTDTQNVEDEKHLCEDCGKFHSKRTMKNHRTIHSNQRPYACKICGKTFKTHPTLHNHKAVHMSTKDFKCSSCPFTTNTKSNLSVHERKHSNVQAYPCHLCDVKFKTASNLLKHLRNVHEKQRTFKCKHCESSYFSRDGLRRHMVVHTGKRPFDCPVSTCKATYLWYSGLRKHFYLLHAKSNVKLPTENSYLDSFEGSTSSA